jgi:hypothetical protein
MGGEGSFNQNEMKRGVAQGWVDMAAAIREG